MEILRTLAVTILIIYPTYSSVSDKGPQTFETAETKKREVQGEGTGYPLLFVPTQQPVQNLQRPQPTQQPQTQYEFLYQSGANVLSTVEDTRYVAPRQKLQQQYLQIRPELHFVPLEQVPQFVEQHRPPYVAPLAQQQSTQKNSYILQKQQQEIVQQQELAQQQKQHEQHQQQQQRLKQQQQHQRQQDELQQQQQEHQQQQQRIESDIHQKLEQELQENRQQQHQLHQQQQQLQQVLQQQLEHEQENQKQHEYQLISEQQPRFNFGQSEAKLQLVPYQSQGLVYEASRGEFQQKNNPEAQSQPRQQFINIQYIATQNPGSSSPSQQIEQQKSQILQIRREHQESDISEDIRLSKLNSQAQVDAIARSPPVVVQKHVSITRHRPVHITKHVTVPVPSPIAVPIPHPVKISVPQPFAVPVEIIRPFAVPIVQTQTIEVEKPVPFEVEKRVPISVEKKVYFKVNRRVPINKLVPVEVTREIPVEVEIHKPETLEIVRHVWEKKGLW